MDKCELEHQALERFEGWLTIVFPEQEGYHPPWISHKGLLFEIFKESFPKLTAGRIRGRLEETWQKEHSEKEWQTVLEILAAWEEWMYAWSNYPRLYQEQ
jgi:hypothetical protein